MMRLQLTEMQSYFYKQVASLLIGIKKELPTLEQPFKYW